MSIFRTEDAMKPLNINVKIECGGVTWHPYMTIIFKHTLISLYHHIRKNCSEKYKSGTLIAALFLLKSFEKIEMEKLVYDITSPEFLNQLLDKFGEDMVWALQA